MKLLYVASNPDAQESLALEREITVLQQKLIAQRGLSNIQFLPYPKIDVDEFSTTLSQVRPDILHVSAHGHEEGIAFSDPDGEEQYISMDNFVDLLRAIDPRPKLIFLSACSSSGIAKELAKLKQVVPFTLGITTAIENGWARQTAVKFYEWLARGSTVQQALEIARPGLRIAAKGKVDLELSVADGFDATSTRFSEPLRLLCCFPKLEKRRMEGKTLKGIQLRPNGTSEFDIELGIAGCPPDTRQVSFFIDDQTLYDDNPPGELAWITRKQPNDGGEIWIDDVNDYVLTTSDFRIHAAVTTSGNEAGIALGSICDGLKRYYFEEKWHDLDDSNAKDAKEEVALAIEALKAGIASRRTLSKPRITKRSSRGG